MLALMSEGKTATEIGVTLGISRRTVTSHQTHIYRALRLTSRSPGYHAVAMYVRGEIRIEGDDDD